MTITKKDVLDNLEQVKSYIQEAEDKQKEKTIGIEIKDRFTGNVIFKCTKTTYKEAVEKVKANLRGANLRGANLCEANLRGANLQNAKFYGRGGTTKISKSQVNNFFKALGVTVIE